MTQQQEERMQEAMNVTYICSSVINMAWMINKDLRFADPNMNNFNKRIAKDSLAIQKMLNCKAKSEEMAEDRAIEIYRAINILSQYNTDSLIEFNNRVETEILQIQE